MARATPVLPDATKALESENKNSFLVVGIDFGTTYSGAAWATSSDSSPESITDWSGLYGSGSDKVPSKIVYNQHGVPVRWGFEVSDKDNPVQWVKLLLAEEALDNIEKSRDEALVKKTKEQLKVLGKNPVDVIADYLRLLWKYVLARLDVRLTPAVIDNIDIRIVLSVPAIWKLPATQEMRRAAHMAGMLQHRTGRTITLEFVAEPEAAALATFVDAGVGRNPGLQLGDTIVVCDAGGGTVDLISYKLRAMNPLKLAESVGASGGLCGATYLDRAFWNLVFLMNPRMLKANYKELNDFTRLYWENGIKKNYIGTNDWPLVTPPGLRRRFHKGQDQLLFTPSHIDGIFDQVLPKVFDLVDQQVRAVKRKSHKTPKLIILVGGFGSSEYLRRRLKDKFPDIEIQQPRFAWSAICRGAVRKGLVAHDDSAAVVTELVSKYSYGTKYDEPFVAGHHNESDRYYSMVRHEEMALHQIEWYLQKGDDVTIRVPDRKDWSTLVKDASDLADVTCDVYYTWDDKPGQRINPKIHKLCTVIAHFPNPEELIKTLPPFPQNPLYREIEFGVEMRIAAADHPTWCVFYNDVEIVSRTDYTIARVGSASSGSDKISKRVLESVYK